MKLTRRDVIKAQAAATAAAVAGISLPANASNIITSSTANKLTWSKALAVFAVQVAVSVLPLKTARSLLPMVTKKRR